MHSSIPVCMRVSCVLYRETGLERGNVDLVAEFDNRIFTFVNEERLAKFLRYSGALLYIGVLLNWELTARHQWVVAG